MINGYKQRAVGLALSPNPSPTDQRPPRLRLCGSAKTRGFPHECLHSLPTTTTANPSSHQPSKWPRNAPVSLLAPTVATYVHPFSPLPSSRHPVVWSFSDRSFFFPESIRAEGSPSNYRQSIQQPSSESDRTTAMCQRLRKEEERSNNRR